MLIIFLTFFLGILDFARMLWTWNAANEATRWGARVSVVCDKGAAAVLANMKKFLPQLTAANVQIDWYDAAGTISTTCDHHQLCRRKRANHRAQLSMDFADRFRQPCRDTDAGILHLPAARNHGAGSEQQFSMQLTGTTTS